MFAQALPINDLQKLAQGGIVLILLTALCIVGTLCWILMSKGWNLEIEYRKTIEGHSNRAISATESLVQAITLNTAVMEQVKAALAANAQTAQTVAALKDQVASLAVQVGVLTRTIEDLAREIRSRAA
jgi:hypothetical protein